MPDAVRVLVTGGAGFIGSTVVDLLVEHGYEVAVLDSLETGRREYLNPAVRFFETDIRDREGLKKAFDAFRPQIVDHHAAQISVTASSRDPLFDAENNVIGSLNVLEAARAAEVEHFIFASTGGALYGNPGPQAADESTAIAPLSPYGAAKACVEVYLRTYEATWGLSYAALRYANVYGPRQTPEGEAGVVAIFTARMLSGRTPVIFGDGDQERDFVFAGDVARANLVAIERRLTGAYNVGTGEATTVNEVAREIAQACSYGGPIEHGPERPGEVRSIKLDATKLRRETGWQPTVAMKEGIALTVAHHKAFTKDLA